MVKPRKTKNESIDAYNERASKLYYNNGYHIDEIAERLNIDPVEVYNYVVTGHKITTSAEREEMIALFNKGYSYSAIAKIFNRSRMCVRTRIERPARVNTSSSNTLTDKQLKKMRDMANDGAYIETIAKELGIPVSSVKYRLNHTNIRNHIKYVSKDEVKQFIKLYKKGKTITEISKLTNRSRNTVSRHLKAAGYCETINNK